MVGAWRVKNLDNANGGYNISYMVLKVLNHAFRTLSRLPYTNLKKSRTEKKTGY